LPNVDEFALRCDPENAAGFEDGLACAEKLNGSARGVQFDGEDAKVFEDTVALKGRRIHGSIVFALGHEAGC
jgi:hypothetical protein